MSSSSESRPRESVTDEPSRDSDGWPVGWAAVRRPAPIWDPPALATTVVVPHPDDEVLMFGGLIQTQRRRGVAVHVIAVTDGDASYPDVDSDRLGTIRRGEQERALAKLGVGRGAVHRLGLSDGAVADRYDAIVDAIVGFDAPIVVAPWAHDHHCDHEASGRAALVAGARTGAATYFGLFWSWTHTDPALLAHQRLIRLPLSPELLAGRHAAISEHRSQVTDDIAPALLNEEILEPLDWTDEYYVTNVEPNDEDRLDRAKASLVRPGRGLEH
jgi:LmbE family N-acetylglucosaminyl deacetylase